MPSSQWSQGPLYSGKLVNKTKLLDIVVPDDLQELDESKDDTH